MIAVTPIVLALVSVAALAAVTLLRWRLAKGAWAHHPGGSQGYLKDLTLDAATYAPLIAAAVALRVIIEADPAQAGSFTAVALVVVGYVAVLVARRLPPVAVARRRARDARIARYEAAR